MQFPPCPKSSQCQEVPAVSRPRSGGPGGQVFRPVWGQLLWGQPGLRRERAGLGAWRGLGGQQAARRKTYSAAEGMGEPGPGPPVAIAQGTGRPGCCPLWRRAQDASPFWRAKPRTLVPCAWLGPGSWGQGIPGSGADVPEGPWWGFRRGRGRSLRKKVWLGLVRVEGLQGQLPAGVRGSRYRG